MFTSLFKRKPKFLWEYGKVIRTNSLPTVARRNKLSGEVQFVLWKKGEQGHKEDYWHKFDNSWYQLFKTDEEIMLSEPLKPTLEKEGKIIIIGTPKG